MGEAVSKNKRSLSIQSSGESLRGVQSRSATPRMSVAQHSGLGKVDEWQTMPSPPPPPPPPGNARATATLARTEVIMKNRMLIRGSWLRLGVDF